MKILALALMMFGAVAWADERMSPSRYITVNGVKIAVYESSGHKKPDILMIHGNTSSAQYYGRVMKSGFAKEFHVMAIDLPGYGNSQNASSYNFGFFADTIAKAAKQLGTDHGLLVGWSLGGDLSLQASHLLPDLKGILVFGTAPVGVDPTLPPAFLEPSQSYAGQAVTYGGMPTLTTAQITDYVTAFFRPNFPVPSYSVPDGVRCDSGTRQAVANVINGSDTTFQDEVAIVRNLTTPIAMLVGDTDAFLNQAFLQAIAPSIPSLWNHQIVTVKNSGHAIQWEHPLTFTKTLRQFIHDVN